MIATNKRIFSCSFAHISLVGLIGGDSPRRIFCNSLAPRRYGWQIVSSSMHSSLTFFQPSRPWFVVNLVTQISPWLLLHLSPSLWGCDHLASSQPMHSSPADSTPHEPGYELNEQIVLLAFRYVCGPFSVGLLIVLLLRRCIRRQPSCSSVRSALFYAFRLSNKLIRSNGELFAMHPNGSDGVENLCSKRQARQR